MLDIILTVATAILSIEAVILLALIIYVISKSAKNG